MNIKNEKGSGLILAIIVMATLMILATPLIMITSTEGKQVGSHYKKIQSYHFAMAGVEFAFEKLEGGLLQGNLKEGFPEGVFPIRYKGNLETGLKSPLSTEGEKREAIEVEIFEDEGDLVIKSTGAIDGIREVIFVRIPKKVGEGIGIKPNLPLNRAAYIASDVTLDGGARIYGGLAYGGNLSAKNDGRIEGIIEDGFKYEFPLPAFPQYPDENPLGNLNVTYNRRINGGGAYSTINVLSNSNLTIDVGDEVRVMRVENLNISGHISIEGTGKLLLYVENQITLNGTINNFAQNGQIVGNPHQLTIFYGGNRSLNFTSGNGKVVGNLYNKSADIHFSHIDFYGNILSGGNQITMTNSSRGEIPLLYGPKATLNISGSTRITGAVVAQQLVADNGTRIEFKASNEADLFPEAIWGGNGVSDEDYYGTPVWGN